MLTSDGAEHAVLFAFRCRNEIMAHLLKAPLSAIYEVIFRSVAEKADDAYLFGSYARGDYHNESDIDILLMVDEEPELLSAYRKQLSRICSRLSLEHDILISAIVKSADQFRKYADVLPFYRNVLTEGIRYVAS